MPSARHKKMRMAILHYVQTVGGGNVTGAKLLEKICHRLNPQGGLSGRDVINRVLKELEETGVVVITREGAKSSITGIRLSTEVSSSEQSTKEQHMTTEVTAAIDQQIPVITEPTAAAETAETSRPSRLVRVYAALEAVRAVANPETGELASSEIHQVIAQATGLSINSAKDYSRILIGLKFVTKESLGREPDSKTNKKTGPIRYRVFVKMVGDITQAGLDEFDQAPKRTYKKKSPVPRVRKAAAIDVSSVTPPVSTEAPSSLTADEAAEAVLAMIEGFRSREAQKDELIRDLQKKVERLERAANERTLSPVTLGKLLEVATEPGLVYESSLS